MICLHVGERAVKGRRTALVAPDADGFTLVELLVAITLLGIIMVAIGAMITTAFRTTTIVSARLEASRAPKLVSTYWVPDVEGAKTITPGAGGCGGTGGTPLVTFQWDKQPDVGMTTPTNPVPIPAAVSGTSTWTLVTRGTRTQVVRTECANGTVTRTANVVPDVGADSVQVSPDGTSITVNVPDRNEPNKQFHFSVDGTQVAK